MVAGRNAETAGKDREALSQYEPGGKICNQRQAGGTPKLHQLNLALRPQPVVAEQSHPDRLCGCRARGNGCMLASAAGEIAPLIFSSDK